ncbi:hypothetical protein NLG97_g4434 [Lecanicillium saksenae]|uniref:Uncharacterized protein n=1 Tax=Lecanicillium saksenae TaxID=468837 RepID=A0ACC1QVW2_9HYPO|nr:hypothetical protein NLG97_g4434 [Lecanicillium saksenae]
MRKSKGVAVEDSTSYFTYRPLSNLPTPPPTARQPRSSTAIYSNDDDEILPTVYRADAASSTRNCINLQVSPSLGPAIHLVNLIPTSASLATASTRLVQSMLGHASLSLETIALAVCILDSLDAKFGRKWRLTCPLRPGTESALPETMKRQVFSHAKRHSLPVAPQPSRTRQPQLHIDSVQPEVIVLAALVIADKFTEDSEQTTQAYCTVWGRGLWSSEQLNATERSIMESLNYRIMPLCDEDCIADAMVDMQLAGQDHCRWDAAEPSPPHSDDGEMLFAGEEDLDDDSRHETGFFVPGHSRSKTMMPASSMRSASVGFGFSWATAI